MIVTHVKTWLLAYLPKQSLHEQQPDASGQLLSHQSETELLHSGKHQSSAAHSSKHDAPGLNGVLHLLEVWVVKDTDDVGQCQGKSWHHDA